MTTHQSTTDPDARLYKKAHGREAQLGYLGHVLMEHRSGLIVQSDGHAGRRPRRTRRRAGDDRGDPRPASHHRRRPTKATTRATSSPSCARCTSRRTSRRTPEPAARQRDRRPHHAASRLRHQSAEAEAGRARLRLDEDGRRPAQAAPSRRAAGRPGSSPSPRRRTTSSGCAACCRPRRDALATRIGPGAENHDRSIVATDEMWVTMEVTFSAAC